MMIMASENKWAENGTGWGGLEATRRDLLRVLALGNSKIKARASSLFPDS